MTTSPGFKDHSASKVTGRFAPSPTGALHLGSLVAALASYLFARAAGGRWLVRMEDLDTPRVVEGMDDDILRTLERFGLTWDGAVLYQSARTDAYRAAFERLEHAGAVYPCGCTRRELRASASAPHVGDEGPVYPGTCRNGLTPGKEPRAHRVCVDTHGAVLFDDLVQGPQRYELASSSGDFVVLRADGVFAYQLAVVVDDEFQGVNQVVRGADLISSTPRQILLQRLLGYRTPAYAHVRLVTGPGGEKLSKRDNLVSVGEGLASANEAARLLLAALGFLGQEVPRQLRGAPCGELLEYAVAHFDAKMIVAEPGRLVV